MNPEDTIIQTRFIELGQSGDLESYINEGIRNLYEEYSEVSILDIKYGRDDTEINGRPNTAYTALIIYTAPQEEVQ